MARLPSGTSNLLIVRAVAVDRHLLALMLLHLHLDLDLHLALVLVLESRHDISQPASESVRL